MIRQTIAAACMGLASLSAPAALIQGSFGSGSTYVDPATGITFTALNGGGTFSYATKFGVSGVGITGGTQDEIDIGEILRATAPSGGSFVLTGITLGVLYDGGEFGDVQEIAQITGFSSAFAGGSTAYRLQALYSTSGTTFSWNGLGSVLNLQSAVLGTPGNEGAVWQITNPFGSASLTRFELTAVSGDCGVRSCSNQSDFMLVNATVPTPGTVMLLGLGLVGLAAARKRATR